MLQKLAPDVEKGISGVAAAQLPGILREKKAVWEENVRKLQAIGSEYKAAASANDAPRLLAAAEKLHGQFEALARSIRSGLGEIDDFHSALYMLYHHYMPAYDFENIKSSVAELKQKMAALNSAKLPERLKQKESEFIAARTKLLKSLEVLEASIPSKNEKAIKDAISELHSSFEALNSLFDR
jgi:DNA mismatch repair ATPase MutS